MVGGDPVEAAPLFGVREWKAGHATLFVIEGSQNLVGRIGHEPGGVGVLAQGNLRLGTNRTITRGAVCSPALTRQSH